MSSRPDPYGRRRDSGDRDRERDRERERDRDRRPLLSARNERDRASIDRYATREFQESRLQAGKTDYDKATAELANLHRRLWDLMAERNRLTTKKDSDLKHFRRKEQDYKNVSASAQFPAVTESLRRHEADHKKTQEATKKELDKVNEQIDILMGNYGDRFVKAARFAEINFRQIIDTAMAEIAPQPKPIADDRFEKLEKQLASLAETQKSQAEDLAKVKEDNDRLRARSASYEAQAIELATLKAQYEQVKGLIDSQSAQEQQLVALKQKRDELAGEVSTLRGQCHSFLALLESQGDEFKKCLEDVKSQNSHAVSVDVASTQDLATLKGQIAEHDNQLSSFDATEYTDAMEKLMSYPSWEDLSSQLDRHERAIPGIHTPVGSASTLQADMGKRSNKFGQNIDTKLEKFSTQIVEKCHSLVKDVQESMKQVGNRLTDLEVRGPSASRAASTTVITRSSPHIPSTVGTNEDLALSTVKTDVTALRGEIKVVKDQIGDLRGQADETRTAHELMIHGLDSQFKNMTTIEMGQIIMDNIKRLSQSNVSLDVQNLHERVASLEAAQQAAQQEVVRKRATFQKVEDSLKEKIMMSLSDKNVHSEQIVQRKRPRMMGLHGMDHDAVEDQLL